MLQREAHLSCQIDGIVMSLYNSSDISPKETEGRNTMKSYISKI